MLNGRCPGVEPGPLAKGSAAMAMTLRQQEEAARLVEDYRRVLQEAHHHDWTMETVSEAAHIIAAWQATHGPLPDVHLCPTGDDGVFQCCGRTPFEVPRTDRVTVDPEFVVCASTSAEAAR